MTNKENVNYEGKVSNGNGESLKGKKEAPNLSAMEAADDWET